MADASVSIGGDASGAIAACAAAQGAIDALHGKTVNIDINTRGGGAGGMGEATRGMQDFGTAADRASRSTRGMGDNLGRSSGHMGRMANDAEKLRNHLAAVDNVMRGGAVGGRGGSSNGMRALANDADRARQSIGELSSGSRGMRAIESGGVGAGRGMRELTQGADGAYRSMTRLGSASGEVEKFAGSMRTIDAVGRVLGGGGGSGGRGGGRGISGMFDGLGSALGEASQGAARASGAIQGMGMAVAYSAVGMGALAGAVAGVGLAGVAEDFAHNTQLMHAGEQAVRGFNKEFTAMRSQTSAAGMPEMAGLKASAAGVGHELASIGAQNMAGTIRDVSALGNSATTMMKQLEPVIPVALQAGTALGGALAGAIGQSAPAIGQFSQSITDNAAGLQSLGVGAVSTAGALAQTGVQLAGPAGGFLSDVVAPVAAAGGDLISGAAGRTSSMTGSTALSKGASGNITGLFLGGGNPIMGLIGAGLGLAGVKGFTSQTDAEAQGTPTYAPPQSQASMGLGSRARTPSPDAARYSGMSAAQIYDQQYSAATGAAPGQPRYGGVGPRGPGQSVGAMPASIGGGLGVGGIAPLNNMMQAAGAQVAGGGAQTGQAVAQHIQKAVNVAAPAAAAGGAAIGAGMNMGMAQGSNSTQSVVDTITIKHSKHIVDLASAALGVHSPSTEFDYLGRMTWAGFGQGSERASAGTFGAVSDHMGGVLGAARDQARKTSLDYDGAAPGVTVNAPKPKSAIDYSSSQANQNIDAHNARAQALAAGREDLQRQAIGGMTHDERRDMLLQNRANNRERALANLGVGGRSKPSGDVNPFAGDQANAAKRQAGLNAVINPFHSLGLEGSGTEHGKAMAQGVTVGLGRGTAGVQASVSKFAQSVQGQHKKDHGISSPATVWIGDGMNLAAGVGVGVTAGTSAAVGAVSGMSDAVQSAGQWLSDKGLMVGEAWATNVVTGAAVEITKANYQALGLPKLNQAAEVALAATGLLSAGSGAESYKTPGNAPGLVVLPAATSGQTVTVQMPKQDVVLNGDVIATIADRQVLMRFNQAGDLVQMQQAA